MRSAFFAVMAGCAWLTACSTTTDVRAGAMLDSTQKPILLNCGNDQLQRLVKRALKEEGWRTRYNVAIVTGGSYGTQVTHNSDLTRYAAFGNMRKVGKRPLTAEHTYHIRFGILDNSTMTTCLFLEAKETTLPDFKKTLKKELRAHTE